jgi:hypothetical protein
MLTAASAQAQDVRDVVREHLEQELERKQEAPRQPRHESKPRAEPRRRSEPQTHTPARDPNAPAADGVSIGIGTDQDAPPAPQGPPLPQRLFERYVQLDVKLGGGYRGWLPQQFPHVKVRVGSYYVWTVELRAKLFRFLNLHRGYYESNALAGPRTQEAAVASQVGSYIPKAAWLLGVLGFPLFKAWEPIIRYESRAFYTEARPRQPVCVVTDAVASDLSTCERSAEPLRMIAGFETFVAGVRYDQSKQPNAVLGPQRSKLPPITFGVGLMSYRKPYQVNVNGNTLDGYLFDGRFRGAGLMLGTDVGGGVDRFSLNLDAQVGLGEVKLTRSLKLNSLAPEDWLMGYVEGNANLGYTLPLYRGAPTLMFVPQLSLGGAYFFFFKTRNTAGEKSDAATANWDLLWSVNASLVLSI